MRSFILIYFLIGTVIMFLVEAFWDTVEAEDDDLELNWSLRFAVIMLWPFVVIGAISGLINNEQNDDNDTIGPGYGT